MPRRSQMVDHIISEIIRAGLVFVKQVGRTGRGGAHIMVPNNLVGKIFRVILIPIDEENYELYYPKNKRSQKMKIEPLEFARLEDKYNRLQKRFEKLGEENERLKKKLGKEENRGSSEGESQPDSTIQDNRFKLDISK